MNNQTPQLTLIEGGAQPRGSLLYELGKALGYPPDTDPSELHRVLLRAKDGLRRLAMAARTLKKHQRAKRKKKARA